MDPIPLKEHEPELEAALSAAYYRVEQYLCALRVRNKRVLSELAHHILKDVERRLLEEPGADPMQVALDIVDRRVGHWYGQLTEDGRTARDELGVRARMSLFRVEADTDWENHFLRQPPLPEGFVSELKQAHLRSQPEERSPSEMQPDRLDLGRVGRLADDTWRLFFRWPYLGAVMIGALYLAVVAFITYFAAA